MVLSSRLRSNYLIFAMYICINIKVDPSWNIFAMMDIHVIFLIGKTSWITVFRKLSLDNDLSILKVHHSYLQLNIVKRARNIQFSFLCNALKTCLSFRHFSFDHGIVSLYFNLCFFGCPLGIAWFLCFKRWFCTPEKFSDKSYQ